MIENHPDSKETNKILRDIQNGNITYIDEVFKKYPDLHWSAIHYHITGDTILHIAARLGHINIIHFLMNRFQCKDVDCKNKDDKTALHEAAQFGQLEACRTLLTYGANVNAIKRADWTPLMLSCTKTSGGENYDIVKLFLNHNASVNYKNKDGWTSLHLICREGDPAILNLLINSGLDLKIKTKNGRTGLHVAALHGHLKIVEMLLKLGLQVNERDNCGNTSLHEAVLSGNIDICKVLICNGADINLRNNSDYGLLHLASSQEHSTVVIEFLLSDLNWNVNESNMSGLTALHCAARKGSRDIYKFLVDKGADEHILDNFNRKPYDYFPS